MSNELSLSVSMRFKKNDASFEINDSISVDVTGDDFVGDTQLIGTSEEEIALVDIGTVGYVFVKNLDATNYVRVGVESGHYAAKLYPKQICLFPAAASHVYLIADTSACRVRYGVVEY